MAAILILLITNIRAVKSLYWKFKIFVIEKLVWPPSTEPKDSSSTNNQSASILTAPSAARSSRTQYEPSAGIFFINSDIPSAILVSKAGPA